jgi:hypothetical protein
MKKKIAIGVLAVFVIMQFFGIDKTNPVSDPSKDFLVNAGEVEPEIANLIQTACYDCHSHNTEYPWYTSIAPVSWWIRGHIDDARSELNFSTFADYESDRKSHKLEECAEVLRDKEMPMLPYMILHSEAWVNDDQRERLAVFFEGQR